MKEEYVLHVCEKAGHCWQNSEKCMEIMKGRQEVSKRKLEFAA